MNKTEFVKAVAEKSAVTQVEAANVVNAALEVVAETLAKGEEVVIPGFGTFKVTQRAARTARNPQTGATIEVPASKAPSFKAGKSLKDSVK